MNQQSTNESGCVPNVYVVGTGQTDLVPSQRAKEPNQGTHELLLTAASEALNEANLTFEDIDGLAVSSFSLAPDHSIDLAVRWNITPSWLMDSALGGASGNDMIAHAFHGLATRSMKNVLIVSGDHFSSSDFQDLVLNYNVSAQDNFGDMPGMSPNTLFALLTRRQMDRYKLTKSDYGNLVVYQRMWAVQNHHAAYRTPLSIEEYLSASVVAEPLSRYDCVPVVSGASAIVLSSERNTEESVRVLASFAQHNSDSQNSDGLKTGLAILLEKMWNRTGYSIADIDVLSLYDDYPAIVIAQLMEAGLLPEHDVSQNLADLLDSRHPTINSSGGQLSAGQAGAAAGLQGVVEIVRALRDQGPSQTHGSRLGLACGYGMVTYRHGSCSNATLLERC